MMMQSLRRVGRLYFNCTKSVLAATSTIVNKNSVRSKSIANALWNDKYKVHIAALRKDGYTEVAELPLLGECELWTALQSQYGLTDPTINALKTAKKVVEQPAQQEVLNVDVPHPDFQSLQSFCTTSGSSWKYQPSSTIDKVLKKELTEHYKNYEEGNNDKQVHPLFLVFSGAGTGKSRLLDEFHRLAVDAVDSPLKAKLQEAFVFNVTFENGTSGGSDTGLEADISIGTRMMWQMTQKSKGDTWSRFYNMHPTSVGTALQRLAEVSGKDLNELTVFLLVDGLQMLSHDLKSTESKCFSALQSVASLINATGGPFVVGVCAATIYCPLNDILHSSPQRRVLLIPPPIVGTTVIKTTDPVLKVLIDDMGGHGRTVEVLSKELAKHKHGKDQDQVQVQGQHLEITKDIVKNVGDYGFGHLANDVRVELQTSYPNWRKYASDFRPLLVAVLTQQPLDQFGSIPGTDWKVDDVLGLGMFRLSRRGVLECPYIWLWMMAGWSLDPILKHFRFETYNELHHKIDPHVPAGVQFWQHWEEFNADFRCLKSDLLDGQSVTLTTVHAGARFNTATADSPPLVHVKSLKKAFASRQYKTKTSQEVINVQHEHGSSDVSKGDTIFINGHNASAGDAFLGLYLGDPPELVREVHQAKHIRKTVTQQMYDDEYAKSADASDVFVLFSSGPSTVTKLPPLSAIVDKGCFNTYYGPFAGRAFASLVEKPDINTASRTHLEAVKNISPILADLILEYRNIAHFTSVDDCHRRTNIKKVILNNFAWPQQTNAQVEPTENNDQEEDHIDEAADDDDDDGANVFEVEGQSIAYADITEDDVAKMTEEEQERYQFIRDALE